MKISSCDKSSWGTFTCEENCKRKTLKKPAKWYIHGTKNLGRDNTIKCEISNNMINGH